MKFFKHIFSQHKLKAFLVLFLIFSLSTCFVFKSDAAISVLEHAGKILNGDGGVPLNNPTSVYISGNYAYVASSGSNALEIVDISNPALPVHTGKIFDGDGGAILGGPNSVFVSGNYAYIASSLSNALEIVNISNPTTPVHTGKILDGAGGAALANPYNIYVSGNYAYVASYDSNALEIVDVSVPTSPVHAGLISDGEDGVALVGPNSVYVSGNYAYITSGGSDALEIVDVSNPTAPVHVGVIYNGDGGAVLGGPNSVYVSGNYAYVSSFGSNALEIVDISNPALPVHVGKIFDGAGGAALLTPQFVYISGNYAYVASYDSNALEIVNISVPTAPVHAGKILTYAGVVISSSDIFVSGNYAYITSSDSNALEIVDISNPALPVHAGKILDGDGGAALLNPQNVYISGNYAYVASSDSGALEIVDVSNPTSPVHEGVIYNGDGGASLGGVTSVFVSGNYAYVTSNEFLNTALEIVDISNPALPVHVGKILNGEGGAILAYPWNVYVSGNYAYIASNNGNALEIVDITNPATPVHAGSILNGEGGAVLSAPRSVHVSGNYAYIASYSSNALEIVDVSNPALPVHAGKILNGEGGAALSGSRSVHVSGNYAYIASYSSNALEIVDISNPAAPVHAGKILDGDGGATLIYPSSVFVSGNYAYVGSNALEIIHVVTSVPDAIPPVITLLGTTPITVEKNSVYTDAGATALDDIDGDITGSIVTVNPVDTSTVGTYTVTYNVSDAALNPATEVTRTVNVVVTDITPPVITLFGSNSITIYRGDTYTDSGATATDNIDGDLTSSIVTVNPVDTNTAGTYTITYNVSDTALNPATEVTRTVNVLSRPSGGRPPAVPPPVPIVVPVTPVVTPITPIVEPPVTPPKEVVKEPTIKETKPEIPTPTIEEPVITPIEEPILPTPVTTEVSITPSLNVTPLEVWNSITLDVKNSFQEVKKITEVAITKTRQEMEKKEVDIATKTVAVVGIATGATLNVLPTLFASPLSVGEIFLIPLRLWTLLLTALGIKKKGKPWGTVYDSVTKQPLDPAYVILKNDKGEEVASSITDIDGRYGFFVEPGTYTIEVGKTDYKFPSDNLKGKTTDELYIDIYQGETITITGEAEVITKNIPMDPVKFNWNEFAKKQNNLMRFYSKKDFILNNISNTLFTIGGIVAVVALILTPGPYNIITFSIYVILFIIKQLGIKQKDKGTIIQKENNLPLPFSIIHILAKESDTEIAHKVADKRGKFYCLISNGTYRLKIDKKLLDGSYESIMLPLPVVVSGGILKGVVGI